MTEEYLNKLKEDPNALGPHRSSISYGQRKAALESLRFIDVRNLAHLTYKKDDDKLELMSYNETLTDRDNVRKTIINYELSKGWAVSDGTENQPTGPAVLTQQGVTQMSMPFQAPFPPPGAIPTNGQPPQQLQQPAPMPQFEQVQMAPQQPQMPQMAPPGMMAPPIASPAQAAQVAAQNPMPQADAAPTGRKRRGAAVAPPPAATQPPMPQMPPQMQQAPQGIIPQTSMGFSMPQAPVPQNFTPPMPFPAPMMQAAPAAFIPPGMPQFQAPTPAPQQFQAPAQVLPPQAAPVPVPGPSMNVDLSPITQSINKLVDTVMVALDHVEKQKAQIDQLSAQLTDTRRMNMEVLAVLHHMYLTNPALSPAIQDKKTLPDFRQWLAQFVGPVP